MISLLTYASMLTRYALMRDCWEERPELRPTFADLFHTISTKIPPKTDPPPATDTTDSNTDTGDTAANKSTTNGYTPMLQLEEGDSSSLFNSILSLLPSSFLTSFSETDKEASPACDPKSDYYTTITPRRPGGVPSQYVVGPKPTTDLGGMRGGGDDCGGVSAGACLPKVQVQVARNPSNVSDYFPMYPAEPAKPYNQKLVS